MMGKQLRILSKMKVPDKGQGTDTYGLQFVYFEKYLVIGELNVQCNNVNEQHRHTLDALGVNVSASQPHHLLYVICDHTNEAKKLPDPPYINSVGGIKYISSTNLSKCLSNTHSSFI